MQRFQYKVIPAPRRGEKAKGAKSTEDRFAVALTSLMNQMGAEGWEYVRADTLPCDERAGLTGVKTSYQALLVFRRPLAVDEPAAPEAKSMQAPLRVVTQDEAPVVAVGAARGVEGPAPRLGAAKPELAAE